MEILFELSFFLFNKTVNFDHFDSLIQCLKYNKLGSHHISVCPPLIYHITTTAGMSVWGIQSLPISSIC